MNNFDPKITLIQKLSMNIIQYAIISSNNQVFGIFPVSQNVKHPLKKKKHPKMDPFGTPNGITTWGPPSWRLKAFPPLIKAAWPSRP